MKATHTFVTLNSLGQRFPSWVSVSACIFSFVPVRGGARQGKAKILFASLLKKKKKKQFPTTVSENPSVPPCVGAVAGEADGEPLCRALLRAVEGKQVCSYPKWGFCNPSARGLGPDEWDHAASSQRGAVKCARCGGDGTAATLPRTIIAHGGRIRVRCLKYGV